MIRLDEKQYRAVKKMTRAACANNDCGNCLLLDDGETCRLCAEYQLFAAMPLFPRSGITRRQAAMRADHPQRGNRFEALRGMRQHVCGGQQPGEILPRLRGKDTPQTESPKREKQAFTDKNNYIASTANEYPFAKNACWDNPKPLYRKAVRKWKTEREIYR